MPKPLKLAKIVTDAGTQSRVSINEDTVAEYSAAMLDGAKFPAVVVFHDGSQHFLADGFHRVMAANRAGLKDILADVKTGTRLDALEYSLRANQSHGLRRSNADKRFAVWMALREKDWAEKSDRWLSEVCGVSPSTVGAIRAEHDKSQLSKLDSSTEQVRIGKDGKKRKVPEKKAAEPQPEPEPPEEEKPHVVAGVVESAELAALKHAWGSATENDRAAFLDWIANL